MATSVWVPQNISTQNWHVASLMINYAQALPYTFLHTSIMVILQTVCTMLAGYSFARFKFRFRSVLFAFVAFTIIVPPQVFMIPQYLFFRSFDIFGIITAITGKPLTYSFLLKSPVYEAAIAKTASMLVFLPLVVLYLFIQRKFVQGVERSGITGM